MIAASLLTLRIHVVETLFLLVLVIVACGWLSSKLDDNELRTVRLAELRYGTQPTYRVGVVRPEFHDWAAHDPELWDAAS